MPGLLRKKVKTPVKATNPGSDIIGSGGKTGSSKLGKGNRQVMDNYPQKAVVIAKEKRHDPVKHYVFIIEVKWSDNSRIPVYRQYSDFAQLHTDLSDFVNSTPEYKKKYPLPNFPSKKVFQRNEISKNASFRRHAFDDYCQSLLKMDTIISQHTDVVSFFKAKDSDINPLTQCQTKTGKNRSSLLQALADLVPGSTKQNNENSGNIRQSKSSGDLSDQMEDDPIYVSSPIVCESYRALADYTPQGKGEIKLKEDQVVEVVEKYANGWWFIQTEYGFGWTPATYLTQVTPKAPEDEEEEPEPVYSGHKYITTEAYKAEQEDELTLEKGVLVKVLHKLMDGWWIVSYQGEVGYAPATYLVSFQNPHFRDSRYGQKQNRNPTNRRRTIKNSSGKFLKDSKERDLSVYKKMNEKLEEIKRNRNQTRHQPAAPNKEQEYEYVDEKEMENVQEWAETQRRLFVSSTNSVIGPPLPPRPCSMSSPLDAVIDIKNLQRRKSEDATGMVYVKLPQTFPRQSEKYIPEEPDQRSQTLGPGATFNRAPPSPRANRKRIQSAYSVAEGCRDDDNSKPNPIDLGPRLSVPEICVTWCDSMKTNSAGDDSLSSSDDEETVESLYSTEKEVKPKSGRQQDHRSHSQTGEGPGDEVVMSDDSSNEEEETVEALYGTTRNVRSLIRTKVQGVQGTVEYTEVNKSKDVLRNETGDEYMPMNRCSKGFEDDHGETMEETMEDTGRKVERKFEVGEHRREVERTQGTSAESLEKMEKSSAQQGDVVTGQKAMDTLINSLRSKSIGGVYTNEKGELCIKFDKS